MFRVGEQLIRFSLPGDFDDKITLVVENNRQTKIHTIDRETFPERKELIQRALERTDGKLMGVYKIFFSLRDRTIEIGFRGPLERIKFTQYVAGFFFPRGDWNPEEGGESSLVFRKANAEGVDRIAMQLYARLEHCEVENRDQRPAVDRGRLLERALQHNQAGLAQRILEPQNQFNFQAAVRIAQEIRFPQIAENVWIEGYDPFPPIPPLRRAPAFRVGPNK